MRVVQVLLVSALAAVGLAQGRAPAIGESHYLNFESPQVRPILAPRIGGLDFVFVCNTPDNSVEVYRADLIESDATNHGFVARIPVGPEPVSVVWREIGTTATGWIYTANWLGDSVTAVNVTGVNPFTFQVRDVVSLTALHLLPTSIPGDRHLQNQQFGHRPLGMALFEPSTGTPALIVCKETASSVAWLPLDFLDGTNAALDVSLSFRGAPVTGQGSNVLLTDGGPIPFEPGGIALDAFVYGLSPAITTVMKEPRAVAVRPGTSEIWFLGHKGGGARATRPSGLAAYDFDLLSYNVSTGATRVVQGLGTANFDMVFHPDGSRLYVVGQDAQADQDGNANLGAVQGGFVRTMLYRVDLTGAVPVVAARDLNAANGAPAQEVAKSGALAQVTGIDYYGGVTGKQQVVVTAHGSDRIAVVDVSHGLTPAAWNVRRISVPEIVTGTSIGGANPPRDNEDAVGPRAVAVRDVATGSATADRAYVLNRLKNTVTVVQITTTVLSGGAALPQHKKTFKLKSDPVPAYIRQGQRFLYNAHFSGEGFVSCASCHIDGRLDQQQWRLGPAGHFTPPDPLEVGEDPGTTPESEVDNVKQLGYPTEKKALTTQSLQGLVNFEVATNDLPTGVTRTEVSGPLGTATFDLFSNAPYHWRGDKPSFRDFNEAFLNLMGFAEPGALPGEGLQTAKMVQFETFIRSLHYPPNPMQSPDRVLSGSLGTPDSLTDGSGARRGLKVFHELPIPIFGGRSCVQCHFLPEGSNNRVTTLPLGSYPGEGRQPMDTPGLRDMRQKEAVLELNDSMNAPAPRSGDFGLAHEGFLAAGTRSLSTNDFLQDVPEFLADPALGSAVVQFLREYDHGVAPSIGRSVRLRRTAAGIEPSSALAEVVALENEFAKANCGVAVFIDNAGARSSLWLASVVGTTKTYRNAATLAPVLKQQLLGLVAVGGVIVFTGTPLGSERRYATLDAGHPGVPATSGTPTAALAGTIPNSSHADVPLLTGNWDPPFWVGKLDDGLGGVDADFPRSIDSLQILQANVPGLSLVKHDAPRRLRILGQGLIEGAVLEFGIPVAFNPAVPSWTWQTIDLPIFRTGQVSGADVFWETAVEFDPLNLYILLAGGPNAPGVAQALEGITPSTSGVPFDTANWNRYRIRVRNPDGVATAVVTAALTR